MLLWFEDRRPNRPVDPVTGALRPPCCFSGSGEAPKQDLVQEFSTYARDQAFQEGIVSDERPISVTAPHRPIICSGKRADHDYLIFPGTGDQGGLVQCERDLSGRCLGELVSG